MFMIIKNKTNLSLQFMNRFKTLKHVQSFDAHNSKKWKKRWKEIKYQVHTFLEHVRH